MKMLSLILTVMISSISCVTPAAPKNETQISEIKVHDCNTCHLPHQKDKAGEILLNKPLSELCVSCHQTRIGTGEHKIGIKPSMAVEGLPLDADGNMTCLTCHDPHGSKGFDMLLRAPTFSDVCNKCHKKY